MSVLVVDDHADTAESLAEVLAQHGFRVRVASCGGEAVRAVAAEPPDVVITDVVMTGMDGFEVARRVRRAEYGRSPFVVAITAYESATARDRTPHGFDLLFLKPLDTNALVSALERIDRGPL